MLLKGSKTDGEVRDNTESTKQLDSWNDSADSNFYIWKKEKM